MILLMITLIICSRSDNSVGNTFALPTHNLLDEPRVSGVYLESGSTGKQVSQVSANNAQVLGHLFPQVTDRSRVSATLY